MVNFCFALEIAKLDAEKYAIFDPTLAAQFGLLLLELQNDWLPQLPEEYRKRWVQLSDAHRRHRPVNGQNAAENESPLPSAGEGRRERYPFTYGSIPCVPSGMGHLEFGPNHFS